MQAEELKNRKEFAKAKKLYEKALEQEPGNTFLKQRLVLMTYKLRQPNAMTALYRAQEMIRSIAKKDSESCGLLGSIDKKLYEENQDPAHINSSIAHYRKGYKLGDYYNGINLAYLYTLKASLETDVNDALGFAEKAFKINTRVVETCQKLLSSNDFENRDDKHFVYQTLAQAYLGLDKTREVLQLIPTINQESKGNFDLDIFHEQSKKLMHCMTQYKTRFRRHLQG